MDLEMRVLQIIDLGLTNYGEVCDLQEKMAQARGAKKIPDTILVTQHHPAVIFGMAASTNTFSQTYIENIFHELKGDTSPTAIKAYLKSIGVAVYDGERGGGASAVAPGQLVFYPIVDISGIEKNPDKKEDQMHLHRLYRPHIVNSMYDTLKQFVHQALKINVIGYSDLYKDNKTDVHYEEGGRKHKLGSLGIRIRKINDTIVSSHGFALYADESGLEHFEKINPCGFDHADVTVTSIEKVTGKRIPHPQIVDVAIKNFIAPFGYDDVRKVAPAKLYDSLGIKY